MKYLLIPTAITLCACSPALDQATSSNIRYVVRSEMSDARSILIHNQNSNSSNWLKYIDDIDGFEITYPADYPKEVPVFMADMSIERPDASCNVDLTGSDEERLTRNNSKWGKVTFWDDFTGEGFEGRYPLCDPPETNNAYKSYIPCAEPDDPWLTPGYVPCELQQRRYEVEHGINSAYVLCSEKNGQTVLICIRQKKDDPALVQKIFESFQWVK